jgi:hypothetical protein
LAVPAWFRGCRIRTGFVAPRAGYDRAVSFQIRHFVSLQLFTSRVDERIIDSHATALEIVHINAPDHDASVSGLFEPLNLDFERTRIIESNPLIVLVRVRNHLFVVPNERGAHLQQITNLNTRIMVNQAESIETGKRLNKPQRNLKSRSPSCIVRVIRPSKTVLQCRSSCWMAV